MSYIIFTYDVSLSEELENHFFYAAAVQSYKLVVCRCRYLRSISVFGIFVGIFYVGNSVFGIGILKYRDIGIGIRYFAIVYNFRSNR